MTPDQIKTAAIEAAAKAMWDHSARGNWSDVHGRTRDLVISEATAAVAAYDAAMVRPLEADAPAYRPGDALTPCLLRLSGSKQWMIGGVGRYKDNGVKARAHGSMHEDGDFIEFRLLPDAPETQR